METWFTALTVFEKVYWVVACIASCFLLIFLVMTLFGGDADEMSGDVDTDIDGDHGVGFQILSFKNLTGFFTIFGWTGIACLDNGLSHTLTVIISVICGLLMMVAMEIPKTASNFTDTEVVSTTFVSCPSGLLFFSALK